MRSILIDTNILMLLTIGSFEPDLIQAHRRTNTFTRRDFELLEQFLKRYPRIVTTPGVLTETSNLMGNDFHETIAQAMVSLCTSFVEIAPPKEAVFAQEGFARLGFADASILKAVDSEGVVLTDDLHLYNQALYLGIEAINFNHLRTFA